MMDNRDKLAMAEEGLKELQVFCKICGAIQTACGELGKDGEYKMDCPLCLMSSQMNGMDQDMQTMRRTHERELWQQYQAIALIESMLATEAPAEERVVAVQVYLDTLKGAV
jgi:hypothetical protein